MRIALVTCERPIERDDDLDFLVPALKRRDVDVDTPGWSDPGRRLERRSTWRC